MCRALSAAAPLGIAAMLCLPVEAQTQELRLYEQRVDSLAKVFQRAQTVLTALEDSLRHNRRRYDSVVVAPVRVLTDSTTSGMALDAARSVVAALTPVYGAALSVVASHAFVVRAEVVESRRLVYVGGLTPDGQEYSVAVVEPRSDVVTRTLQQTVMKVLGSKTDATLFRWLGGAPQIDTAPATAWTNARIALLSSQATVGRDCYSGDLNACSVALGLVPVDDPATAWFDSAGRRSLITTIAEDRWRNPDPTGMTACIVGSDTACISVLRRFPTLLPGAAIGHPHRASLVQLAVQLGGAGATERLLLTPGTPSERIAAAARIPSDSVVRLWLGRARDVQLASGDMSAGIAASALAWFLACAALSLRSSRWR